jgi:hypothetical protein
MQPPMMLALVKSFSRSARCEMQSRFDLPSNSHGSNTVSKTDLRVSSGLTSIAGPRDLQVPLFDAGKAGM